VSTRRWHRLFGLALFLPFIGWAASGLVFFFKPGYAKAYAPLAVHALGLSAPLALEAHPEWLEARALRTVLGDHLLVRTAQGWRHLRGGTLGPWPRPRPESLRPLIDDAIAVDPARYGRIAAIDGEAFVTTSGVRVTLDWDSLTLSQRGRDTARIDGIYRLHYLQWTGIQWIDRALGLSGLLGITVLAVLDLRIALRPGLG
jgi:hypothetical protein